MPDIIEIGNVQMTRELLEDIEDAYAGLCGFPSQGDLSNDGKITAKGARSIDRDIAIFGAFIRPFLEKAGGFEDLVATIPERYEHHLKISE